MEKHSEKKEKAHKSDPRSSPKRQKTVRGSGFTYDEDKGKTDQSTPLSDGDATDVGKLPNLGKRNRP